MGDEFGPQYGSRASAFYAIVRADEPVLHPATGKPVGRLKPLLAEFGVHGGTGTVIGPDGKSVEVADIHGHLFDLDVAATQHSWDNEEKGMVRARLDYLCQVMPGEVWHLHPAKLTAPWPTYDEVHHKQVVELAGRLGLAEAALAYEKQNANRPSVIEGLTAILREAEEQSATEASLTVA